MATNNEEDTPTPAQLAGTWSQFNWNEMYLVFNGDDEVLGRMEEEEEMEEAGE